MATWQPPTRLPPQESDIRRFANPRSYQPLQFDQPVLRRGLSSAQTPALNSLGFDTDNDSVFMNETVRNYCEAERIAFTRCRPYRKNDQAWVEQKNGAVVRRIVGYRRFEGLDAAAGLARLYAAVRLFVNFFQPSFKLAGKARAGAKVRKRYHPAATPFQRLLADPRVSAEVKDRARAVHAALDPVALLLEMRAAQQHLVDIADTPVADTKPTTP